MSQLLGSIEAGGTKFVCAVGTGPEDVRARTTIATTQPDETLQHVIDWLKQHGPLAGVGISCFGPVDLDTGSDFWGHITRTPKEGWSGTNIAPRIGDALGCPIGFDTDVNGAALGEYHYGAAQGCDVAIYVTVGTGIGGGAVVRGVPVHGVSHPEMGHFRPIRYPRDLQFNGICTFHGGCLEGLASGPAIKARWGMSLSDLPENHDGHDIIADYLSQLCTTLIAFYAPGCIALGGGVMKTPRLLNRIREKVSATSQGYFTCDPKQVICKPSLGDAAGITGSFVLAQFAKSLMR